MEVELGCESWTSFASGCSSTAVALVAAQWRGDTALTLPLFWRRSTVSPVFFKRYPRSRLHSLPLSPPPPPPLSPSLIINLASVDVKQHGQDSFPTCFGVRPHTDMTVVQTSGLCCQCLLLYSASRWNRVTFPDASRPPPSCSLPRSTALHASLIVDRFPRLLRSSKCLSAWSSGTRNGTGYCGRRN